MQADRMSSTDSPGGVVSRIRLPRPWRQVGARTGHLWFKPQQALIRMLILGGTGRLATRFRRRPERTD